MTRLYHLEIRMTNGTYRRLTGYPMAHKECCVMKSKFQPWQQARILFVESHWLPLNTWVTPVFGHWRWDLGPVTITHLP